MSSSSRRRGEYLGWYEGTSSASSSGHQQQTQDISFDAEGYEIWVRADVIGDIMIDLVEHIMELIRCVNDDKMLMINDLHGLQNV